MTPTSVIREGSIFINNYILLPAWEDIGAEPHFYLSTSSELLEADKFVALYMQTGRQDDAIDLMINVSEAITGEALFERDKKWSAIFQDDLKASVNQMPLVRAFVNVNLEEALLVRKVRRHKV